MDHFIPKLLRFRAGKVDFDPRSFRERNRSHSRSDAGQSGYSYQARIFLFLFLMAKKWKRRGFPKFESSIFDPKIDPKIYPKSPRKLGDLR